MLQRKLRAWLDVPNVERRVAMLALILGLPSLLIGMQADDFLLATLVQRDPLGAFAFVPDGAREDLLRTGRLSWAASPELMQSFLRPLGSLSHWLDATLLRDAPWAMHLENVLLYAALVLLAARTFARLIDDRFVAGLAALLYAVNGAQSSTVGWISGRNTLMGALFGIAAFALHERARAEKRWPLAVASIAVLVVALASSEGALAALALIVAYGATLDPNGRRAGLLAAAPAVALGIAHVALRGALGHGSRGMGFYVDVGDPVALARGVAEAVPTYLASQLTVAYASLSAFRPGGPTKYALVSIVVLAALTPFFAPLLRDDRRARFFLLAAASSAVVLGGTVPQDRLVFFVGFGATGLLALRFARIDERRWAQRLSSFLLWVHVPYATLMFVPLSLAAITTTLGGSARALDAATPERADAGVVIVHGPNEIVSSWVLAQREYEGRVAPARMRILYGGGAPLTARAIGDRSLELRVERGWLATPFERTHSDRDDWRVGEVVALDGMRATVRELTEHGTPRVVEFELDRPLAELTLLRWRDGSFEPWTPRAEPEELAAISPF